MEKYKEYLKIFQKNTKLVISLLVGIMVVGLIFFTLFILTRLGGKRGGAEPIVEAVPETVSPFVIPTSEPSPTPYIFSTYPRGELPMKDHYIIYLVGDSMTKALGPRGGIFNELLSNEYKGVFFEIFNYAEANQNIASLPSHMKETVQAAADLTLPPLLSGTPDLIIIESFGYNPLSDSGIEEGLKKQDEVLTEVMTTLTKTFPTTSIMFMATIAPDRATYAKNLDGTGRPEQADERIAYIKNHSAYAKAHDIPLINVYEESLDGEGDGSTQYISVDDNIHPSLDGLFFIGEVMTKSIVSEKIFQNITTP